MTGKNPKIIVTGYPYAYPYYFKVFEYLDDKQNFIFVLPKHWEAKKGKVKIDTQQRAGFEIFRTGVCSYGGKSLLSGLFKGWMPAIGVILPYMRLKYGSSVLYSCSEPNLLATLYNGIFASLFGYKHVLFTWQNVPPEERMSGLKLKLSNYLVRLNLALSDGVICGNKKASDIIKKFKIKNLKFTVLVCPLSGVDVEKFKFAEMNTSKEKTVLFYGALEERKGVEVLLRAFSKISIVNANLVIIGTGPEKEKLKDLANQLGINEKVKFLDWMKNEELPVILKSTAVFVYPSLPKGGWEEQFGYAMGEASASGVPVIASRTGSIDEVVKDGETGILVNPGNADELKSALEKLLSNDKLRQEMGQAGRKYIVENFSHQVVANKISDFLHKFLWQVV